MSLNLYYGYVYTEIPEFQFTLSLKAWAGILSYNGCKLFDADNHLSSSA